jgi:hypothetical protein
MTTCNSCDAEVMFVPSAKSGKSMILDAKPVKGVVVSSFAGALALHPGQALVAGNANEQRASVVDVYTDHHATCPLADEWRGKKRRPS